MDARTQRKTEAPTEVQTNPWKETKRQTKSIDIRVQMEGKAAD